MSLVSQRSGVRGQREGSRRMEMLMEGVLFSSGIYILTKSLVPLLEKSGDPRVVRGSLKASRCITNSTTPAAGVSAAVDAGRSGTGRPN